MFHKVIHTIVDTIFPRSCAGCAKVGVAICAECARFVSFLGQECFFCSIRAEKNNICSTCAVKYPIEAVVWPWRYRAGEARRIIAAFKYRKKQALASVLGEIMREALANYHLPKDTVVIPVPLYPAKEKERGFNQAALLARNLGYPMEAASLIRIKETAPQARAHSRGERFEHMRGAFCVVAPNAVCGKNILLVDDVATTGATLCEAAQELKKAGASKIYAAVLAHG